MDTVSETLVEQHLCEIDALIAARHLLNHDFYQAWSRGELSRECLQDYAKQYYHHVKAFPTYLSALHSRTEDASTRRVLLQNLIEEEAGSPNHPELWKQFAVALGCVESQVDVTPSEDIQRVVGSFRALCGPRSTAEGIAALYAYESQIPAICVSKIKGLREWYGMKDKQGWEYFTVHIAADEEHAAQERALLASYITPENAKDVKAAVQRTLDALWQFLSGLCHQYNIACPAA